MIYKYEILVKLVIIPPPGHVGYGLKSWTVT